MESSCSSVESTLTEEGREDTLSSTHVSSDVTPREAPSSVPALLPTTPLEESAEERPAQVVSNPLDADLIAKLAAPATTTTTTTTTAVASLIAVPKVSRAQIKHLSKPEKAQLSRERNRVHAKNTRLRKKAHVEDMKQALNDLVQERDAAMALEERQALVVKQNRDVRFMVMTSFMSLQENTAFPPCHRWETLLEEDATVTFPCYNTDAMTYTATTMDASTTYQRTAQGVPEVMELAAHLVQSMQNMSGDAGLQISYHCDRKSLLMDGATAVVEFTAETTPSSIVADCSSQTIMGSLKATFCVETNKIQSACVVLDTGLLLSRR